MFKRIVLLLLMGILVFTSACGKKPEEPASVVEETPMPTPSETPEPVPEKKFGEDFVVPDSSIRPVSVMIDNQGDRVLPQGGISQAQIVYEMLVEGDITRYMAFFWGTMPEMIGPVRSSRHYFLDYAMEYDAYYIHVGGSTYAKNDIKTLKINHIDGLFMEKPLGLTQDKKLAGYIHQRVENQIRL